MVGAKTFLPKEESTSYKKKKLQMRQKTKSRPQKPHIPAINIEYTPLFLYSLSQNIYSRLTDY